MRQRSCCPPLPLRFCNPCALFFFGWFAFFVCFFFVVMAQVRLRRHAVRRIQIKAVPRCVGCRCTLRRGVVQPREVHAPSRPVFKRRRAGVSTIRGGVRVAIVHGTPAVPTPHAPSPHAHLSAETGTFPLLQLLWALPKPLHHLQLCTATTSRHRLPWTPCTGWLVVCHCAWTTGSWLGTPPRLVCCTTCASLCTRSWASIIDRNDKYV